MEVEVWDLYTIDGEKTDETMLRGEDFRPDLYHIVAEILVRHKDGSYLITQRDHDKLLYPGQFVASAGGSIVKGETAYEGALRELEEETGLVADMLEPIYRTVARNSIYMGYLCITDKPKDSVRLQEGETIDYFWLDQDDFLAFVDGPDFVKTLRGRLDSFLKSL